MRLKKRSLIINNIEKERKKNATQQTKTSKSGKSKAKRLPRKLRYLKKNSQKKTRYG